MANNLAFGEHPANTLEPRQGPGGRAIILVRVGCFIASTGVLAALKPLPGAITGDSGYLPYIFYIYLMMLFLFGMCLIVLGWRVSDDFARYNAVARTAIRVSHIVLVSALALAQMYSASTGTIGTAIFGIFHLNDLIAELDVEADEEEADHDTEAGTSNSRSDSSHNTGTAECTGIQNEGESGAETSPDEASSNSRCVSTSSGGGNCIESDAESRDAS